MNLEQVAHFIRHPHELTLQDAEALRSLTAKYPFSSVYPLLYLTALSNGKSPDLDLALKQHAFKLSDRTKLYYLLTQSAVDPSPSVQSAVEEAAVDPSPVMQPKVETAATEEVKPTETPVAKETASEETEVEETATEPEIDSELLDFDQLTEAFTLEQHFEVGDIGIDALEVDELRAEEPEAEEPSATQSPVVPSSAEESSGRRPSVEEPVIEERKSFTSWLKSGQQQHVQAVSQDEGLPAGQTPSKKMPASHLIDKFIEEEPSITRSKTDFFSPSKKAKESLDEDAVPVSETLAKIYAAQGNYPKAIHVYHQLMLSVPEKKALFALQIDELKKKITP